MSLQSSPEDIHGWFSEARMRPYLLEADGDHKTAINLYKWNAELSAACFEVMSHLEVLIRNALDGCLQDYMKEQTCGIPWFLMPINSGPTQTSISASIDATRLRLRAQKKEIRPQIIANLSFGFWTNLLGTPHEELWRHALHSAFPQSSGKRKDVAAACNNLRLFRNRLAHPDSLLAVDVPFQLRKMLLVAGWIDPDARTWLESIERVSYVYSRRPTKKFDTVVIPGSQAWDLYQKEHVYVCQAGRSFRQVDRIGFYADKEVKAEVPFITNRVDNVDWSIAEQQRLLASAKSDEKRMGKIMKVARDLGWTAGRYQVFLLSRAGDPRHRILRKELNHQTSGRGTAFVQKQRYVSLHDLEIAATTADLPGKKT